MEILVLFGIVIGLGTLLAYLERPRSGPRYSGKVYDPQPRPERRAGAERVGITGKYCHFCTAVTYGFGSRCGRCKRLPVQLPIAPTESTHRRSLVESSTHLPTPAAESSSLIAVATTPRSTKGRPSSLTPVPSRGSGDGGSARGRSVS